MNNSFGTEILLAEEKFKKKVHKVFPLEGKLTNSRFSPVRDQN